MLLGYEVPLKDNVLHRKEMNQLVQETLHHQLSLSPILFLRGYISSNWDVIQNLYLKQTDFNNNLVDWATKVIKAVWTFSCGM